MMRVAPVGFCEVISSHISWPTKAVSSPVLHRLWDVSHHQPFSAPSSSTPPHLWQGWGEGLLWREKGWKRELHLGATPRSHKSSHPMPQQLHLHGRRLRHTQILLWKRYLQMLYHFAPLMSLFVLSFFISRWSANWVPIWHNNNNNNNYTYNYTYTYNYNYNYTYTYN